MNETPILIFRLPNKMNDVGLNETERMVKCECIQGIVAQEIQALWDAYHDGCAGLNPTAYRECVALLNECLIPLETDLMDFGRGENKRYLATRIREALQHAEGKE